MIDAVIVVSVALAIVVVGIGVLPIMRLISEWQAHGRTIRYRRWVDGKLVEDRWRVDGG